MSTASTNQKITFFKILVAIDGSDESMNAVDYAIFILSKEYNSAELLYALHVIHPAEVNLSFGQIKEMPPSSYYVVNINKEAQKYLDKVKLKANENNIQIKTEIIASIHVVGGIVDYAEDKDVDLIVVGTRGKSGFKKVLLGSVASSVVTYAHCPVLVVK